MITEKATGFTGLLLQLGPFGGAYVHGWGDPRLVGRLPRRRAGDRAFRVLAADL